MGKGRSKPGSGRKRLMLAEVGVGPLLQRDYWAVIKDCRGTPEDVMRLVRRHFHAFSPDELVIFSRADGRDAELELGDELDVKIVAAGTFRVRVIHMNEQSLTVGTISGHPEAGRITFGSYRNGRGDVLFHIRSHARSSNAKNRAGFLATGEVMQTSCWTDFVNRVAVACGSGVVGFVHAMTSPCADEPADVARNAPTFVATGG